MFKELGESGSFHRGEILAALKRKRQKGKKQRESKLGIITNRALSLQAR